MAAWEPDPLGDHDGCAPSRETQDCPRVFMYDVFVTYRHSDADTVRAIVAALERRGPVVWFDADSIADFGGISAAAKAGIAESKALVAFYSAAYPQSSPCQWELTTAFVAALHPGDPRARGAGGQPRAAPSHIEPVELRDALYQALESPVSERIEQSADAIASHVATFEGQLGPRSLHPGAVGAAPAARGPALCRAPAARCGRSTRPSMPTSPR